MVSEDYVMRIVRDLVRALAKTFLGKETVTYELPLEEKSLTDRDHLFQQLMELLDKDRICDAEDLLFDNVQLEDDDWYEMALVFYSKINDRDDDYLEEHDYSRDEIKQGLREITKLCGYGELPGMLL